MIVGLLLAAGRSRRFDAADKLLAPFEGRPLVAHAAEALRRADADRLLAVCANPSVAMALPGYEILTPEPDDGLSASLRAGAHRARAFGAARLLVVLGDMPRVTPDFMRGLIAACDDVRPAAVHDGARFSVPSCFPAAMLPGLLALGGDRGAAALLRGAAPGRVRPCPAAPGCFSTSTRSRPCAPPGAADRAQSPAASSLSGVAGKSRTRSPVCGLTLKRNFRGLGLLA